MGAVKNNLDRFEDTRDFDRGVSYGRFEMANEALPILRSVLRAEGIGGLFRALQEVQDLVDSLAREACEASSERKGD